MGAEGGFGVDRGFARSWPTKYPQLHEWSVGADAMDWLLADVRRVSGKVALPTQASVGAPHTSAALCWPRGSSCSFCQAGASMKGQEMAETTPATCCAHREGGRSVGTLSIQRF